MDRGLYIIASGMLAELARQDRIANDLANAASAGYKQVDATQQGFGEILLRSTRDGSPIGRGGLGVVPSGERVDLGQGPLRQTGEQLDLALDGDGFLAVQTPAGIRYTRDGQLRQDEQGRLVTAVGLPILGANGRPIVVSGQGEVVFAADGSVSVGGKAAGKLAVVQLKNVVKVENGLLQGAVAGAARETAVRQGALEGSSVTAARTMVDMIESLRAFEADQRVVRAIDESLGRGISAAGPSGT